MQDIAAPLITTCCRDCVFAEYKVDPENSAMMDQMDCKLRRIHKFDNKELKTEEKDKINYNFYQINGRICNAARDLKWQQKTLKKYTESPSGLDFIPSENDKILKNEVLKEVRIDYDLIINIPDFASNIEYLRHCVEFSANLEIPPKNILLIHHENSKLNNIDIFKATRKAARNEKISVETIYDDNTRENKMNKGASRCKSTYFVWAENFVPILTNREINRINDYLNISMGRFVLIEDDLKNFEYWHTDAFKRIGGHGKFLANDKIRQLSKEQNSEYLIKKYSEISISE